jgi:hypothetical protein
MLTRRNLMLSAASAAAAAVPLAACSTFNATTPAGVASIIKTICGVVADIAAVAALIPTFPLGTTAAQIAAAFCNALASPQGRLKGSMTVIVNGVSTPGGYVVINGITVPYATRS